MTELVLRSRQRTRHVHSPLLRRVMRALLTDLLTLERYDLGIHLVASPEMTRINQQFLDHAASTDVITFDYSGEPVSSGPAQPAEAVHGEIFICIDDAVRQSRQFRTTWQSELVRYFIHGVLHLLGYDDATPAGRRVMKREENRLLRMLSHRFSLRRLAKAGPSSARKSQIVDRKS